MKNVIFKKVQVYTFVGEWKIILWYEVDSVYQYEYKVSSNGKYRYPHPQVDRGL